MDKKNDKRNTYFATGISKHIGARHCDVLKRRDRSCWKFAITQNLSKIGFYNHSKFLKILFAIFTNMISSSFINELVEIFIVTLLILNPIIWLLKRL